MAEIGVGLVGYKFMGRTHSNAYRQVARFFDVDPEPRMVALAGRDEAAVSVAARQLGWESYVTDYRELVAGVSNIIGFEHTFTHAIKDLLEGIASGNNPHPDFEDGFCNQAVLDAVERSASTRGWTTPVQPVLE